MSAQPPSSYLIDSPTLGIEKHLERTARETQERELMLDILTMQ